MIETERLTIRPPIENDRARFVELFTDEAFTVFSEGAHDVASANVRFDGMLGLAAAVPYAKQPIIENSSGLIIGYTGVGTVAFEQADQLEWGWRLSAEARGRGYATEATAALLRLADSHDDGQMLCIIDVDNAPSRGVADKLGFELWRQFTWPDGVTTDLLTRPIGAGGVPLLAPSLNR